MPQVHATYDVDADAAYVYVADQIVMGAAVQQVVVTGTPGVGEIVIDFDQAGTILGFEILGASQCLSQSFFASDG